MEVHVCLFHMFVTWAAPCGSVSLLLVFACRGPWVDHRPPVSCFASPMVVNVWVVRNCMICAAPCDLFPRQAGLATPMEEHVGLQWQSMFKLFSTAWYARHRVICYLFLLLWFVTAMEGHVFWLVHSCVTCEAPNGSVSLLLCRAVSPMESACATCAAL